MSSALYNKEFKEEVKKKFYDLKDTNDFVHLLNYINTYGNETLERKKITKSYLYYLSKSKDKRYEEFPIPKKNGEERTIQAPKDNLKHIQSLLNILLQIVFERKVNYHTNGFIINRSIVRNATPHLNKKYVLNLDIQDFFPSIYFRKIKTVLSLSPFDLNNTREPIAFLISNLCVHNNYLPQGAPTSPIISNIVTQRLDRKIIALCNKNQVRYSRYADDLSFSTNKELLDENFINEIKAIVQAEGFCINDKKTRLKTSGERQEVTGIVVNRKLNLNKTFLRKTRAILNNWEKKGFSFTQTKFSKHYNKPQKGITDFRNVLWGYISFIGLVRGKQDKLYKKYFFQYVRLKNSIDYSFITHKDANRRLILDNIEMEKLYCKFIANKDENFVQYCTKAFHQVENLLYYFYWKRFPILSDLSLYLYNNNPELQKRFKTVPSYGKIGDIQINHLVYIFEKEFYFDKKISYNKEITFLRNARNDDSHRCLIDYFDVNKIREDHHKILEYNKKYYLKNKKNRPLTKTEEKTLQDIKFIEFIESKNYNKVREILRKMVSQIYSYADTVGKL